MAVWGDDPSLSNQQSRFQSDTRNPSLNPFFPSSQRKPHLFPFFSCPMNDSSFVSDTRTHCHSDDRQSAFVKLPVSSFLSDHLIFFFPFLFFFSTCNLLFYALISSFISFSCFDIQSIVLSHDLIFILVVFSDTVLIDDFVHLNSRFSIFEVPSCP